MEPFNPVTHRSSWRALCDETKTAAWEISKPRDAHLLLFHAYFRDEAEEHTIPDAGENLPDLLQSARPPIYDEPGVRVVELNRGPDSGLGISIVGGKVGPGGLGLKGIFIRHVLESSPAARLGTLVTGDQILEVMHLVN